MTKEQAYEKLECTQGADLQLVRKQFAKLHNDFQVRIDNAPTRKLKQAFERGQEECNGAYALFSESDPVDVTRSLPHSKRSSEDEAMGTEPHVKKMAHSCGLDRASALFGVGWPQSPMAIGATMGKRISKLRRQYYGMELPEAKKEIKQALLEVRRQVIAVSVAARHSGRQKKSKAWLLLLPLLLIDGNIAYCLSPQTQRVAHNQARTDISVVGDLAAWSTALTANKERTYPYYLKEYPSGIFAEAAKDSLTKLAGAKAAAKSAAAQRKRQEDSKKPAVPVPQMVYVAGGSFQMGGNEYDDEKPVHTVHLSSYSIGKYAVTFDEFDAFCDATGRNKPDDKGWGRGRRPVINVTWHDAVAYCKWLSEQTGQTYRLPTEAEWEFAARGGNSSRGTEYSGSSSLGSVAWHKDNSGSKTHPVGQKAPNELGIYDMSGNVYEWCSDRFGFDYYASSPASNPTGPESGNLRVLRGGSWSVIAVNCRVATRFVNTPGGRTYDFGFRVVCPQ